MTNYAGENPYPNFRIYVVTQELDGDESDLDDPWTVDFKIFPVVDGFSFWTMRETVSENATETNQDIPLDAALTFGLIDGVTVGDNPPEVPVYVEYDLSNLIEDAQIEQQLRNLESNPSAGLPELVANYIAGNFTYNAATGRIRVLRADVFGIFLSAQLFFQSNVDFSIPVSFLVRDEATIGGVAEIREVAYNGTLDVDLVGTADPPTVFANDAEGFSLTRIPVFLGGALTDTDIALGRNASETLYFIVNEISAFNMTFDYTVSSKYLCDRVEIWNTLTRVRTVREQCDRSNRGERQRRSMVRGSTVNEKLSVFRASSNGSLGCYSQKTWKIWQFLRHRTTKEFSISP